jgi:D-sedoheptulose 7-phosphate isomerase
VARNSQKQIEDAQAYYGQFSDVLSAICFEQVDAIAEIIFEAYCSDKTMFIFGNGGSASLATHFACDLGKGTGSSASGRKRFRAIALTDNIPTITAWANDSSYDNIFSEQLENLANPGDLACAISCSGNSANVLKGLKVARGLGAKTIGLGGFEGGKMKSLCDKSLIIPSRNMQIIEDLHLSVAHCIFTILKSRIDTLDLQMAAVAAK